MRDYDPYQTTPNRHAEVAARRAARSKNAAELQAKRIDENIARRGQSPLNTNGLTPAPDWRAKFAPTLGGVAQKQQQNSAPALGSPSGSTPSAPMPAPLPAPPSSGVTSPSEMARIRNQYSPSAAPAITPPTSIVPQGNPNALKPGEGWQSPTIDPRGASTVRAPDGIIERVGSAPGKGGGNIASMYRPPAYNGRGESPTGIVHNNIPKPAPTPQPPSSTPTPPPLELQKQAIAIIPDLAKRGSAANTAYVEMFRRTGSHQAALEAAQATQPAPGSALPAEYAKISPY